MGVAGCQKTPEPIQNTPDYADTWKTSSVKLKTYSLDMPTFTQEFHDYVTVYNCSYKGKDIVMYQFDLSSYTYSGGVYDSDERANNADDAITKSIWNITGRWGRILDKTMKFELNTTKDEYDSDNDTLKSYVTATVNGDEYVGYWVMISSKESDLWLVEKATGSEMIDEIFSVIYKE